VDTSADELLDPKAIIRLIVSVLALIWLFNIFIIEVLGLWYLASLSPILQLYHGGQFYCWQKQVYM